MASYFKRPGVPVHKTPGVPAHNNLCCCHEDPASPCGYCNFDQTPNGIEVTIPASALEDYTCGGLCESLADAYILEKVDAVDCYYTHCEDDPCNGLSPFGEQYFLKIMALITGFNTIQVLLMFGTTETSPACNSDFNQIRFCSWTWTGGGIGTTWDCLDDLDDDATADLDVIDPTANFCHAANTVHVRALN